MSQPSSHGGARPGAGRKLGYVKPGAKRAMIVVKVTTDEKDFARKLGEGNASEGVRRALALAAAAQT